MCGMCAIVCTRLCMPKQWASMRACAYTQGGGSRHAYAHSVALHRRRWVLASLDAGEGVHVSMIHACAHKCIQHKQTYTHAYTRTCRKVVALPAPARCTTDAMARSSKRCPQYRTSCCAVAAVRSLRAAAKRAAVYSSVLPCSRGQLTGRRCKVTRTSLQARMSV